ncbi:hypothetical protein [Pseudaestuariivita atlantica]|uniref:Uncharacterized protein n=1 Tax=Pseudaestuariivita atlantica TaxID=1317121 RepID=A0A0L1JKV6_9RHOB|nr:hypothetical protein [Pseudaestuariivita atlantica]KNG92389.1 hypothetical protein ATO11_17420 [Pseudaestuariivita atlantica]
MTTLVKKAPLFLAATVFGAFTSTAALAQTVACDADAGILTNCLTGEEVDVDNQAAEGPGRGAERVTVGTVDDQDNGQADGGSAAVVGTVDDQDNGQADGGSPING